MDGNQQQIFTLEEHIVIVERPNCGTQEPQWLGFISNLFYSLLFDVDGDFVSQVVVHELACEKSNRCLPCIYRNASVSLFKRLHAQSATRHGTLSCLRIVVQLFEKVITIYNLKWNK